MIEFSFSASERNLYQSAEEGMKFLGRAECRKYDVWEDLDIAWPGSVDSLLLRLTECAKCVAAAMFGSFSLNSIGTAGRSEVVQPVRAFTALVYF